MSYKAFKINTRDLGYDEGVKFYERIDAALNEGYSVAFVSTPMQESRLGNDHYVLVYLHKKPEPAFPGPTPTGPGGMFNFGDFIEHAKTLPPPVDEFGNYNPETL